MARLSKGGLRDGVVASCELELNHVTYGGGYGVGEVLEGVVG